MNPETTKCQNCQKSFEIVEDDFAFYKKMAVPAPTWCPVCRFQRRVRFWNEHNLYRKKDANTGKDIFSQYSEHSPFKIYEHDYWLSDNWPGGLQYGRDYDFSKPFFEQFRQLMLDVPWSSRSIQQITNSDYSNQAARTKNCYLCFNCNSSEDCLYGVAFFSCKQCMDIYQADDNERSYEIFNCDHSYNVKFSRNSSNNRDSWLLDNCKDCTNCFGCVNLTHQQYNIFNVPYTKEDYEKKLKAMNLGSHASLQAVKKRAQEFWKKFPVKYMHSNMVTNTHGGDYVYQAKNARYCYQAIDLEDCAYVQNTARGTKDCMDFTNWSEHSEQMYEASVCGEDCQRVRFSFECWPACTDIEYTANCRSSSNLFGCVGLKKKQYCIFNKQYSKEEYEALVPKIRAHMNEMPYVDKAGRRYAYGEFFPPEFSGYAYNESSAMDYFPLAKEEAIEQGYRWTDINPREFQVNIQPEDLPDHIKDVADDILKQIIACEACKRAYRIVPMELALLRSFGIPLPRKCHECRFQDRRAMRTPYRWYERVCDCGGTVSKKGEYKNLSAHEHAAKECANSFESPYSADREEIVYCESCYQSEMV